MVLVGRWFFYLVIVKLSGEVVEGPVGLGALYGYWFLLLGLGIMGGEFVRCLPEPWENRTWFDCHRWFDHAGLIGHPVSEQPHGQSL